MISPNIRGSEEIHHQQQHLVSISKGRYRRIIENVTSFGLLSLLPIVLFFFFYMQRILCSPSTCIPFRKSLVILRERNRILMRPSGIMDLYAIGQ